MDGWIKLHRKFTEWEWYDDHNVCRLFLHLLFIANHTDKKWRGILVKRGQLITGLHSLSEQVGLSVKQVRRALEKLEKTGELDRQAGNRFSIITICNYDKYQNKEDDEGKPKGKQRASKGQTEGNKQECKECKEVIDYLNLKTGKRFSHKTEQTAQAIAARIKDGYTLEDLFKVIDNQYAAWANDERMREYLRPSTLFRPGKFDEYLNNTQRSNVLSAKAFRDKWGAM